MLLTSFNPPKPSCRTDFWHGEYFGSNPLFTFHKVTLAGGSDVFMGQCVHYRCIASDGTTTIGLGMLDSIFENEETKEINCSLRRCYHIMLPTPF
jgi:hypothetical protein